MIYNETIIIHANKARRILETCKYEGIELYDAINEKSPSATGVSLKNFQKQTEGDLIRFSEWSENAKNRMREIFLTPRLVIEFNNKNKFEENMPTNPYGLQVLVKETLLQQIYFLEIIINEIDEYKSKGIIKTNEVDVQKFGLTNFSSNTTEREVRYK